MAAQPDAQGEPGVAFLLRRLERAAAVPPAERSPEVPALVESAQLLRDACQLLPMTGNGRAALPAGLASQRRLLLALAKLCHAGLLCPAPSLRPVSDCSYSQLLAAYPQHVAAMDSDLPQFKELRLAVLGYIGVRRLGQP